LYFPWSSHAHDELVKSIALNQKLLPDRRDLYLRFEAPVLLSSMLFNEVLMPVNPVLMHQQDEYPCFRDGVKNPVRLDGIARPTGGLNIMVVMNIGGANHGVSHEWLCMTNPGPFATLRKEMINCQITLDRQRIGWRVRTI
jgi:hypothetical protein